jgi:hypothetical protein
MIFDPSRFRQGEEKSITSYTAAGPWDPSRFRRGEEKDRPAESQTIIKQNLDTQSSLTVTPTPVTTPPPPPPPASIKIKSATPEIILWDESLIPVEILTDLIFENIGGQELLSITRHDIINGENVSNQLIKNLTFINQEYSSKRILSLQNTSDKYFSNFSIKLESKIPFEGNGLLGNNIYIDQDTQDIVIEFINLEVDERVEVQIGIGGTIYTITLEVAES